MTRVLVIDNYDSFTWNLVHLLGPARRRGRGRAQRRHHHRRRVWPSSPDAIVLSPGPCTPNEAGICLDLVRRAGPRIPIFGVCLGLQTIGQAFGGTVSRAPLPMHGKVSEVEHRGATVFRGINGPFKATRYHSLIVERESCPADLRRDGARPATVSSWGCRTARCHRTGCSFTPRASCPSMASRSCAISSISRARGTPRFAPSPAVRAAAHLHQ